MKNRSWKKARAVCRLLGSALALSVALASFVVLGPRFLPCSPCLVLSDCPPGSLAAPAGLFAGRQSCFGCSTDGRHVSRAILKVSRLRL